MLVVVLLVMMNMLGNVCQSGVTDRAISCSDTTKNQPLVLDELDDLTSDSYSINVFRSINEQGQNLDGEAAELYDLRVTERLWRSELRCFTVSYIGMNEWHDVSNIVNAIAGEYVVEHEHDALKQFQKETEKMCPKNPTEDIAATRRRINDAIEAMLKASGYEE